MCAMSVFCVCVCVLNYCLLLLKITESEKQMKEIKNKSNMFVRAYRRRKRQMHHVQILDCIPFTRCEEMLLSTLYAVSHMVHLNAVSKIHDYQLKEPEGGFHFLSTSTFRTTVIEIGFLLQQQFKHADRNMVEINSLLNEFETLVVYYVFFYLA